VRRTFYADFFGYFATLLFKRLRNTMSNADSFTPHLYDRWIFPVGRLLERVVRVPVGKNVVAVATPSVTARPDDEGRQGGGASRARSGSRASLLRVSTTARSCAGGRRTSPRERSGELAVQPGRR
jgi:hypothetical protein